MSDRLDDFRQKETVTELGLKILDLVLALELGSSQFSSNSFEMSKCYLVQQEFCISKIK